MGALERYGLVLRAPHVARLWAVTTIARLPIGINSLAMVLAVRAETGSFAAAGAAAGAHALTVGLSSPLQGRLVDRVSPRRAVPPLIAFHAVMMLLFVALLPTASVGILIAVAALAGLGQPPWSSLLRAMWPRLLGDEALITTAFALDSTIVELVFVLGPLFVAAAVAVAAPEAALLASVVFVVVGTALLLSSPAVRAWESEVPQARGPFGALASRGLLTVVLATVPVGVAFGAFEISLPAFAEEHGNASDAGILIAVWAIGSGIGGLAYGGVNWSRPLRQRWLMLSGLLGLSLLPALLAPSTGVLIALLLLAGAFIAPAIASGSQLMGTLAPPGMTTEAYAWGPTALVVGVAGGSAAGGALAESYGWRAPIVLAAAMALGGAGIAVMRRATLRQAWGSVAGE
ncbi:MAG: MFS transporter [Solirubrobacteraceae bacterium]